MNSWAASASWRIGVFTAAAPQRLQAKQRWPALPGRARSPGRAGPCPPGAKSPAPRWRPYRSCAKRQPCRPQASLPPSRLRRVAAAWSVAPPHRRPGRRQVCRQQRQPPLPVGRAGAVAREAAPQARRAARAGCPRMRGHRARTADQASQGPSRCHRVRFAPRGMPNSFPRQGEKTTVFLGLRHHVRSWRLLVGVLGVSRVECAGRPAGPDTLCGLVKSRRVPL
ncbi:hypothetical protein FHS42_004319 [Streptomyces zagrosensis]|uniref:Uncharacterized protein n=1 Tax=Streptomyces zagrosensis TaxID=1042984 RepID=A0A7W9QBL1_9ACTN|nr:hypothetical protein [Streptomyces zagrosensis]